ncbi:hypothetical protein Kpol_505p34 [Vanderwaltozyma polyspora DSM 70294]|uniref:Uncharacterized protein n=1 Tax=Vanderwaltozyma polyspora (strain ATCC 22028 / DSM 70294 / BCRC 21397 / CBS 2163 / NBRC 10782 / NRRL Y-8283 / UCD 57-17) TaxID=436907 RepID=A7TNC5_VANPO|nr:uncharacterized protein Kpol_505p34 [Vanderwaltozyma polyspora DSM 70294]EDO16257.1 hypothetical protein Kpol_505p34 [Vanderwaltozyma polyspora DSM 70294]
MFKQNGTLIIPIKSISGYKPLIQQLYFIVRIGDRCSRFHVTDKYLELNISEAEYNRELDWFVFKRVRKIGKANQVLGIRRELLGRVSFNVSDHVPAVETDTRIEWNSLSIKFHELGIGIGFDLEFYPNEPIVPLKIINTNIKPKVSHNKKIQQAQKVVISSEVKLKQNSNNPFRRIKNKLNYCKNSGQSQLNKIHDPYQEEILIQVGEVSSNRSSSSNYSEGFGTYTHGPVEMPLTPVTSVNSSEIASYIKQNIRSAKQDDVESKLSLDVQPMEFFKSGINRLQYSQRMKFQNNFSSMNVKITGYIGNGKWIDEVMSLPISYWYLQNHVESLPGPMLPPKCPVNMLWEEYYIIDKEKYIQEVIR